MGIRLLRGGGFTAADIHGRRSIAVVNQTLAQRHLAGLDPIGQVVTFRMRDDAGHSVQRAFDIVGVVADAKNQGLTDPVDPAIFVPYSVASPPSRPGHRREDGRTIDAVASVCQARHLVRRS
jgi:hypothetical protein